MTTENETSQETIEIRDIDTLLRLSSYSEMNDYEVDRVIEWKANNLADEYWRLERDALMRASIKDMQERAYSAKESADAAFERAMSIVPQFEEVKSE